MPFGAGFLAPIVVELKGSISNLAAEEEKEHARRHVILPSYSSPRGVEPKVDAGHWAPHIADAEGLFVGLGVEHLSTPNGEYKVDPETGIASKRR